MVGGWLRDCRSSEGLIAGLLAASDGADAEEH
jgi:hypothetical protein